MTPVLANRTVTNNTAVIQLYQDYLLNTITVAPGETVTFQEIASYTSAGSGLPDSNIPADSRYIKIKNRNGDYGYIYPNISRNGTVCKATEPAEL
jgi:hypothetical protein